MLLGFQGGALLAFREVPTQTERDGIRDPQRNHGHRDDRCGLGDPRVAALRRQYGAGRWRKLKGIATVRLASGTIRRAELHRYEAHGVGRKEFKRKRYLD